MPDNSISAPNTPQPTPPAPRRRVVASNIEAGSAVIRGHLKTLPNAPGVYRMLDSNGDALYVGKAKSLRKRVANYLQIAKLPNRLKRMVAETATMEFVTTHTEVEALLLESNLIKRLMPRYNILMRDDKSFAYIRIGRDHPFPELTKHRGRTDKAADYYGPFASAGAVNRTITALQRGFMLRNCSDAMLASRTRPCLQYQIKRCTAPCVARVSEADYAAQVAQTRAFLSGRSTAIQADLAARMQKASDAMDYEAAALLRDRIQALTSMQARQDINVVGIDEADIIAAHQEGGHTCIEIFFFRQGRNYGNRAYFPSHDRQQEIPEVLAAFIAQFYENKPAPPLVMISHEVAETELLQAALTARSDRKVELCVPQRGDKKRLIDHALLNAREALGRRMSESASQARLLDGVAAAFGLEQAPQRIEVYDNSHIGGTNAIGGMIVAGPEGFLKTSYRKFNMRGIEAGTYEGGDDYAMMKEMLTRRFARALREDPERAEGGWPDLVLIDGGQGQLGIAHAVMAELGITELPLVAIAKGPDRNAGRERFFMPGCAPFSLDAKDPVLYYLQRLRDEAHRFAIGTHRAKRAKALVRSPLDEITGIGPSRKKALLHHFGSARAVEQAGLGDLEAAPGISKMVAQKVYDHFHEGR